MIISRVLDIVYKMIISKVLDICTFPVVGLTSINTANYCVLVLSTIKKSEIPTRLFCFDFQNLRKYMYYVGKPNLYLFTSMLTAMFTAMFTAMDFVVFIILHEQNKVRSITEFI